MDQSSQFDDSDPFFTPPPPPPPPPRSSSVSDASDVLSLPPEATYPIKEALFEAIQSWAKLRGYTFITGKSKRLESRRQKVYYTYDHRAQALPLNPERIRDTRSRRTGCNFSIVSIEIPGLGWEVRYRPEAKYNSHNHPPSQSPAVYPSYQYLSVTAQNTVQQLHSAG